MATSGLSLATDESLDRSASTPDIANHNVTLWVRSTGTSGAYRTAYGLDDAAEDYFLITQNGDNGAFLTIWLNDSVTGEDHIPIPADTWVFVSVNIDGATITARYAAFGETELTEVVLNKGAAAANGALTCRFGNDGFGEPWGQGLALPRIFDQQQLSEAQMLDLFQSDQLLGGEWFASSTDSTTTPGTDESGSGNDFTNTGAPYTLIEGPDLGPAPGVGAPWLHSQKRRLRGGAYLRM